MRFLLQLPGVRSLHKRQLLFPSVVLVVVAGVLAQGTLERSDPASGVSELDKGPIPAHRLVTRADLEKTPLAYFSDYWHQLAKRVQPSFVLIGESRAPGLLVGPGLALTTVHAARETLLARTRRLLSATDEAGRAPETPDDRGGGDGPEPWDEDGPHRLRSWDERIGLALFDVDGVGESVFILSDPRSLPSGSYLSAITLDGAGRPMITTGHLVATRSLADGDRGSDLVVSMDLPDSSMIAAVVDLDGALLGLAFESPEGLRVVTTTTLLGLIGQLQMESVCRSIEVSDLDATVKELLNLDRGVLVEHLRTEVFNPQVSLAGGDILVTWAGKEVNSREQFEQLYDAHAPGSLVSYRALRAGRRVRGGAVMPNQDCTPLQSDLVPLPRFGIAVRWVSETREDGDRETQWRIVVVAPDGPAALVGVQEGDRLLSVNGQSLDDQRARRRLEAAAGSEEPLLLSLRRDDRAKLVAVPLPATPLDFDEDESVGEVPQ